MTTDRLQSEPDRRGRRILGWALIWVVAATLAVVVGVVAVTTVGASIRGRGPLGVGNDDVARAELNEGALTPDPGAEPVRRTIEDEFGTLVVECQGAVASGIEYSPDRAAGWRTVSFERGPDDDVDAVFVNRGRSIEVEVFCPRGVPTVAEIEFNELPGDG